jgi:hypothetical protein
MMPLLPVAAIVSQIAGFRYNISGELSGNKKE